MPNILGDTGDLASGENDPTGALYKTWSGYLKINKTNADTEQWKKIAFNADYGATTKGIYGNSTTVQPNGYVINIWQRTA